MFGSKDINLLINAKALHFSKTEVLNWNIRASVQLRDVPLELTHWPVLGWLERPWSHFLPRRLHIDLLPVRIVNATSRQSTPHLQFGCWPLLLFSTTTPTPSPGQLTRSHGPTASTTQARKTSKLRHNQYGDWTDAERSRSTRYCRGPSPPHMAVINSLQIWNSRRVFEAVFMLTALMFSTINIPPQFALLDFIYVSHDLQFYSDTCWKQHSWTSWLMVGLRRGQLSSWQEHIVCLAIIKAARSEPPLCEPFWAMVGRLKPSMAELICVVSLIPIFRNLKMTHLL